MEINKGWFSHEIDPTKQYEMLADPKMVTRTVDPQKSAPIFAELRRAFGLSQAELARLAGISQKMVSAFERRVNCNPETLQKIAKVLLSVAN